MRHACFIAPGRVEWRDAPDPVLHNDREAIVRPLVVGRCDLDVAYVRGLMQMASGEPIGHEVLGEIVDLGDQVGRFEVGQKVFVPAQINCGDCRLCRRGATAKCERVPFAASYGMGRAGGFGGGLADLMRVPFASAMLTPVPPGADLKPLIGIADMASDSWRAVAPHLERRPGARVLVLGGAPAVIGLFCVAIAVALGGEVNYVDGDPERARIAKEYGTQVVTPTPQDVQGLYDVIVVSDARRLALERAFAVAAPDAVVTSVTPAVDGELTISTGALYHRGVTWIIARPDCRHAHDGVMHTWSTQGFQPDRLPTVYVDWEQAPEAWTSDALYVAAVRS